eukprot:229490-Rhodomonas_salina.1
MLGSVLEHTARQLHPKAPQLLLLRSHSRQPLSLLRTILVRSLVFCFSELSAFFGSDFRPQYLSTLHVYNNAKKKGGNCGMCNAGTGHGIASGRSTVCAVSTGHGVAGASGHTCSMACLAARSSANARLRYHIRLRSSTTPGSGTNPYVRTGHRIARA